MSRLPLQNPAAPVSGFTLIELLVTMALMVIVGGLVMSTVTSTRTVMTTSSNQAARIEDLQSVAALVGDDVRGAKLLNTTFSAAVQSWASLSGVTDRLYVQASNKDCASYEVAYLIVPRSTLTTSTDTWLKLQADTQNTSQQALLRFSKCDGTVKKRLVMDYLDQVDFKIAEIGTTNFVDVEDPASAGNPYKSVQFTIAAKRKLEGREIRVPASGNYQYVGTSRVAAITTP